MKKKEKFFSLSLASIFFVFTFFLFFLHSFARDRVPSLSARSDRSLSLSLGGVSVSLGACRRGCASLFFSPQKRETRERALRALSRRDIVRRGGQVSLSSSEERKKKNAATTKVVAIPRRHAVPPERQVPRTGRGHLSKALLGQWACHKRKERGKTRRRTTAERAREDGESDNRKKKKKKNRGKTIFLVFFSPCSLSLLFSCSLVSRLSRLLPSYDAVDPLCLRKEARFVK